MFKTKEKAKNQYKNVKDKKQFWKILKISKRKISLFFWKKAELYKNILKTKKI